MKNFLNNIRFSSSGENRFGNRALALLLCFALLMSLVPRMVLFPAKAVEQPVLNQQTMHQDVGKQAVFDAWSMFDLAPNDAYAGRPMITEAASFSYDELQVRELVVLIEDTYFSEVTGEFWYKVGPRAGETLPDILAENPWVLFCMEGDQEAGFDPYLILYHKDAVIKFVSATFTVASEPIINYFIVSGPSSLKDSEVTITYNPMPEYQLSALSYRGEYEASDWYRGFDISITGGSWTAADGEVAIRYENSCFGANTFFVDPSYGGSFIYVEDQIYSAVATDLLGYTVSDVIYTCAADSTIVFEVLDDSLEPVNEEGYFSGESVMLKDVSLVNGEEYVAPAPPTAFTVEMVFTYEETDWFWISCEDAPSRHLFLVPAENVTFHNLNNIFWYFMDSPSKEDFENQKDHFFYELEEFVFSNAQQEKMDTYFEELPYRDELVYTPWSGRIGALMPAVPVTPYQQNRLRSTFRSASGVMPMAEGDGSEGVTADGVTLSKVVTFDPETGHYKITLEAFTTGSVTVKTEKTAVDAILVLDISTSMDATLPGGYSLLGRGKAEDVYKKYSKVYVSVNGSYREVTISGSDPTVETIVQAYTGQKTASQLYSSKENLYVKDSNGQYQKVTVTQSGWFNYSYSFDFNGVYPNRSNLAGNETVNYDFYTLSEVTTYGSYTYSYRNASNVTVTHTYAPDDSIVGDGNPEYYIYTENTTRIDALRDVVEEFIASIEEAARGDDGVLGTDDDIPHRISIVLYNCQGIVLCGLKDMSLPASITDVYEAKDKIVINESGTRPYLGLDAADQIFKAQPGVTVNTTTQYQGRASYGSFVNDSPGEDTTRQRVVLFFTDGYPTDGVASNYFNVQFGHFAISEANILKKPVEEGGCGATVFSVAVVDGLDPAATLSPVQNVSSSRGPNVNLPNNYLHAISSNYPNAVSILTNGGGTANDGSNRDRITINLGEGGNNDYYVTASSSAELLGIFDTVSKVVIGGGSSVALGTQSSVQDVISEYFELPEGATEADIKVYTAHYHGGELDDPTSWDERVPYVDAAVELSTDRKKITVSNFSYKDNWVGMWADSNGNKYPNGTKLIIEVPIVPSSSFLGGGNVPTNDPYSGIYDDTGHITSNFERPVADILIADIEYKKTEVNIYYGNRLELKGILDNLIKSLGSVPLENVADGFNNAFLKMQFHITSDNGDLRDFVYTLQAGHDWSQGVWTTPDGQEIEGLESILLDEDTTYTVHMVMGHAAYDVLGLSIDIAQIIQDRIENNTLNYTSQEAVNAFLAVLAEAKGIYSADSNTTDDAHVNIEMMEALEALIPSGSLNETAGRLEQAIIIAQIISEMYAQPGNNLPYQIYMDERLPNAITMLNSYNALLSNPAATEEELALGKALAEDATTLLLQVVHNVMRYHAVEGDYAINVFYPTVTLKDSVRDYLKYLWNYTVDSFKRVRDAFTATQNEMDTLEDGIYQAIFDLDLIDSYGESYLDNLRLLLKLAEGLQTRSDLFTPETLAPVLNLTDLSEGSELDTQLKIAYDHINQAVGSLVLSGSSINEEDHVLSLWITLADSLDASDYDSASFAALSAALAQAKVDVTAHKSIEDDAQRKEAYAASAQALKNAINGLDLRVSTGNATLDALQLVILQTQNLHASDFTLSSFKKMEEALWEMRYALEYKTKQITSAVEYLELNNDYGNEDTNDLVLALSIAGSLTGGAFTNESFTALQQACAAISSLSGDGETIYEQIEALQLTDTSGGAKQNLRKALLFAVSILPDGAKVPGKTELTAEDYAQSPFDKDTTDALFAKYREAQSVLNNSSATSYQMNSAQTALIGAVENLKLKLETGYDVIDDLLPYLLMADALHHEDFPDQQAFLQSHLESVEWFDSDGLSSLDAVMEGVAPKVELEYEVLEIPGVTDPFKDNIMNTLVDVPAKATIVLTGKEADGVTDAAKLELTKKDTDLITFKHDCDRPPMLCFFNPETEDFLIHVRNLTLVIEVNGLVDYDGLILFQIQDENGSTIYATVEVDASGTGYAIIFGNLQPNVKYTVTQLTDWNWCANNTAVYNHDDSVATVTGTTSAPSITILLGEDLLNDRVNHVVFTNVNTYPDWLGDEGWIDNNLSNKTVTAP